MDGHLLALAQVVHVAVALVAELFETEPSVHQDTLPEEGQRRNIQGVLSKPQSVKKRRQRSSMTLFPILLVWCLCYASILLTLGQLSGQGRGYRGIVKFTGPVVHGHLAALATIVAIGIALVTKV